MNAHRTDRWQTLSFTSEALCGNPLGDPHVRSLHVYVPDDTSRRYPSVYVIQGMTGMARGEDQQRLSGTVQVDDAYLGGEQERGKPGRGSENKIPFVAAVSLNDAGNPLYVKV